MATAKRVIKTGKKASTVAKITAPTTKAAKATIKATPKKRAPKADLPVHDTGKFRVVGASGPVRSSKKLSPVVLNRVPAQFTARDQAFLEDVNAQFGTKTFQRRNFDGGLMSRACGFGYLEHVGGGLDDPEASFRLTKKAISEHFRTA